jgi:hypothetical protein
MRLLLHLFLFGCDQADQRKDITLINASTLVDDDWTDGWLAVLTQLAPMLHKMNTLHRFVRE